MKSKQLKTSILSAGLFSFMVIVACSSGNNKAETADANDQKEVSASETAELTFKDEKIGRIYSDYITLKDALVESNDKDASVAAGALQVSLNDASQASAADLAGKMASASTLASQRESFNALSEEIEKILKGSDIVQGTVYKQYCPMANGDKGGYWLANEAAIRNPYYGDEMMTCGSVKEEIK